ncbi:MAG: penicillin-binding protein 2 [Rhodospirillales bacterium]
MTRIQITGRKVSESEAYDGPERRTRLRIEGDAKQAMETGRNRLVVGALLFAMAFAVVAGRLIEVGVLGTAPDRNTATIWDVDPDRFARADIVDRNGVVLATNLPTRALFADARIIAPDDATVIARQLAGIIPDLDVPGTRKRLASGRAFIYLHRDLTPAQVVEVNRLGVPGLNFEDAEARVYPHGRLVSHVIGLTDIDNNGLAGIEKRFDENLRGSNKPLKLSLDVRVQHMLREELYKAMTEFSAIGAAGLVMDVRTGELIGMSSLPDFDPNNIETATEEAIFNRGSLGVYEMGSTFKLLNTAMALDSGRVNLANAFDASNPLKVARFQISDYHAKNRWLTVPEILVYSSNIGSARMAKFVGTQTQRDFLGKVGMLHPAALEIPEVGAPLIPSPWRDINTLTISFGHGIAVSPVQLVNSISTLINGGIYRDATLLARDVRSGQVAGTKVIKPSTSDAMRALMRAVVMEGTGKKAIVPGYMVGGKTGTAEKQVNGRYKRKALMSSFIAAFPMQDPRYVVLAMLDEPKGTKATFGYATGGWVAAPVVGAVIRKLAHLYAMPPVDETEPTVLQAVSLPATEPGGMLKLASY